MNGICNRDCFHCPFEDCVEDEIFEEEAAASDLLDEDVLIQRGELKTPRKRSELALEKHRIEEWFRYHSDPEKARAQRRDYYQRNKEQLKAYQKAYRHDNAEYLKRKNQAYHEAHREQDCARRREKYHSDPARRKYISEWQKQGRKKHPEKYRERDRRWREAHPEQERKRCQRYREAHRDEINARKRERYRQKKLAAQQNQSET